MAHAHMAEVLDLDAEVLHEYHREVFTWVASLVPSRVRVVDLGAGTGVATAALAQRLPDAEVVAVDVDEQMLEHIRHKTDALGVGDRIRTVRADLDQPWPPVGPADLVWAANSMHHMGDPGRTLAQVYGTLRPGGVFAVSETKSFPLFLTDGPGAELEIRCQAALNQLRTEAGMHMQEAWDVRLRQAGFAIEAERRFDVVVQPPLSAAGRRYAELSFQRARDALDGRLSADELADLDAIVLALPGRADLTIRTNRTVWLARRPTG
jgi:SAM-dependent methyltransferase